MSELEIHETDTATADATRPASGSNGTPTPPEDRTPANSRARKIWRWVATRDEAPVTAACLILLVLFSVLRPANFPTESNLVNVARDASILLILTVGTTFVTVMGMFDLSIGSVAVFAQVLGVKVMMGLGGDSLTTILLGVLASLLAGAAWGILNGWLIATLRLSPFIVTLATLGAALGAAELVAGGADLTGIPLRLSAFIGVGQLAGLPYLAWFGLSVALVGGLVLAKTRFGRRTYALGSNEEAVRRAGVNAGAHIVRVYVLMGVLAGIAGFLGAARFGTTSLSSHTNDSLDAITAAALGGCSLFGGKGTVLGAAIAVSIPALLQNGLVILGTQPYWYQIIVAAGLLGAIYLDRRRRRTEDRG